MVSEGFAFCVIVRDIELSEEIIAALMEAGAGGVTVISSRGLSKATFHRYTAELSIATLKSSLFTSDKRESLLLFCLVKNAAQLNAFCELVANAAPNIDRPGSVIHFAIPVSHLRGLSG
jgi:hypothetical protein